MDNRLSHIQALNQTSFQSLGDNISCAQEALKAALELGHLPSIAESHFVIGHCLMIRGRTVDAIPHLAEANRMFGEMPDDPMVRRRLSPLHVALAYLCDDQCDYLGALAHCETALRIAMASGDAQAQQRALVIRGYFHFRLGHAEQAIDDMMEGLRHPAGNSTQNMAAIDFTADLLEQQGLWAVVLRLRLQALSFLGPEERFRKARVRCGVARCLMNMNRSAEAWNELEAAEAEISGFTEPIRALGNVHEARSLYFLRQKQFGSAWHFQQKMAEVFHDCGSRQFSGDALLLKAEIELQEGKLEDCRATCATLQTHTLSFHRQIVLDTLREKLCCSAGHWAEAYRLHLATEARQQVDLGVLLERKEEIHRLELDGLQKEALLEKNQHLEQLGAERDDLMHLVVHDIANYLQVTRTSIEAAQKMLESPAQGHSISKEELIARSLRSLDMTEEVLGQLRLLWQVESDPMSVVHLEAIPLAGVIEQSVAHFAAWAQAKKQSLRFEVSDPALSCRVNRQHLGQIMSNLISNAIKFSGVGTKVVVRLSRDEGAPKARIDVEDEGQGMSAQDLASAFQRFRRLSARPTAGEPSNGLGLYLVKRMAEPMGGELCVRSPGKNLGTVFTVKFPLAAPSCPEPALRQTGDLT